MSLYTLVTFQGLQNIPLPSGAVTLSILDHHRTGRQSSEPESDLISNLWLRMRIMDGDVSAGMFELNNFGDENFIKTRISSLVLEQYAEKLYRDPTDIAPPEHST